MLREVFDRVRVINLPERTDRRAEIASDLAKVGLPIDDELVRLFAAVRPESPEGFPSIGARGCFMSHLEVLREARAEGVKRLLIVEDDCQFTKELIDRQEFYSNLFAEGSWDLLWIGHGLDAPAGEYEPHLKLWSEVIQTTHCMGVSGSAFDLIISELELMLTRPPGDPDGGPMHVDGAYATIVKNYPDRLKRYACFPSVAGQRSSRSDIADLKWWDKAPLVRNVAAYYRSVFSRS